MFPIVHLNSVKVLKSTSVGKLYQALTIRSLKKELYKYHQYYLMHNKLPFVICTC